MKKRLLILACALALLAGCMVVSSLAATQTGYCEYCKETVTWEPIKFGTHTLPEGETSLHKHYYFDKDYTHTSGQQINLKGNDMTLCIDLNGKSWYSYGRAFYANTSASGAGDKCTINVQDSKGGGTVTARSEATGQKADGSVTGTNNTGGCVFWIEEKSTVNIYGGTFMLDSVDSQWGLRADSGGIASVKKNATLNVYGGVLQGGNIKKTGGAVYLYAGSNLNVYGGVIRSGHSGNNTGACVGLATSTVTKVTLSGDAQVDNIYLPALSTVNLAVDGNFTGKANLTYKSDVTLAVGTQVGTLANSGSVADADIFCTNGSGYSVVADGTALKLAEVSAENLMYECQHCKQKVVWEVFTTTSPSEAGTYHFYLNRDYGTDTAKQYSLKAGVQVCLDLHGHKYNTVGRSLATSGAGSVFNVMDTVGGGTAGAIGGSNNPGGGTVNVASKTTFNLYSGTLDFTHNPSTSSYGGTGRGGVIQNSSGTVNIYGGKIVGGEVVDCTYEFTGIEGAGGAIYNNGTLNILGGEITAGKSPESGAGPCIYNVSGKTVTLGGDAKVEDIFFATYAPEQLTVTGTYTGSAGISYAPEVVLSERMKVGVLAAGADASDANISCGGYFVLPSGQELVLSSYSAATVAATGGVGYESLQDALEHTDGYIELLRDVTGDFNIDTYLYLQLNGCSIDGTLTVAEGKTLYCMDSATDDFTVADGNYGVITKVVGHVKGITAGLFSGDNYLMITEESGISFHCVRSQIYAMTLRVDSTEDKQEPSLFYKSHFKGDEKAAAAIETYGVALSLVDTPDQETLETECCYSEFTGFESGALGNLGNTCSTQLTGILKNRYSDSLNAKNLERVIYGSAYIKTADGQYLFGMPAARTLADQLEAIDPMIDSLSKSQVNAVVKVCNKFKDTVSALELPGITKAIEDAEAGTLKVLVLGNSHGLDATNLLYEVFHQEREAGNHDQDVLIAALYYSGCRVDQHYNYLKNNQKVYTYHKNDGSQPNRAWVVRDATCLEALQDEQWDVILMQQMNTNAARESYYKAAEWKYVADYLLNNQDIQPILGFHMTWANPDDYALYLNDDAPYKIKTGTHVSWRTSHETTFPGADGKYDQTVMYNKIVELTQKYLVDSTDWLGKDYFDERYIMNSATPVHYAQNVMGRTHEHIYRDYTHMNDYGRLICAYQWYAQLMGLEELAEVNTDVIPANLKHRNSKFPSVTDDNGDYVVDEEMKSDLIASVNWALKNPFSLPAE